MWVLDYQFDQTEDGRRLKLLNVVDEHTHEALAIAVNRRIDADATVAILDRLVAERGAAPSFSAATFILSGVLMEPVGSGRPRRFIGDRRSSVTAG